MNLPQKKEKKLCRQSSGAIFFTLICPLWGNGGEQRGVSREVGLNRRQDKPSSPKTRIGAALKVLPVAMLTASFTMTAAVASQGPGDSDANPYSQPFTTFESGQVRPLAITPDKKLLLATNTPDAKLEIFRIQNDGLQHVASVPVGLEPVAVVARNNNEAWVVNHLSDSISIVKLNGRGSRVERTLLVGDEPSDIVFAGTNKNRAFVTTAHRGQNSPVDPQLDVPGVGRADVWVFDADGISGDGSLGGTPSKILTFFSDTPRALTATPDGSKVYAAAFHSGNGTASTFVGGPGIDNMLEPTIPSAVIPGINAPVNAFGEEQPLTSLIVKYDGEHWRDETGGLRDEEMMFTLPDRDVFAIDANANPPAPISGPSGVYAHVGTTLFNMVVNPVSGKVYVSNLESNNQQRFEGENHFAAGQTQPDPSVRGKIALSRITVLDDGSVTPRHLNKHIDYKVCCASIPNDENAKSVAFPLGMEITQDGKTLYVAAVGSSEVAVYDTAQLESDTFVPNAANQIQVSGGGPTGLALDEGKKRLYVLTRFDNSIKIVNTQNRHEIGAVPMFNPEPEHVVKGRRFLYDASFSSSHGDSACFSCHMFGDMDHLAWDLGNPDDATVPDPNVYINDSFRKVLASMKGVMTTQSLRGMDNMGPMHWRGDRTGANLEPSAQPNSGAFNEQLAFKAFNVAFPGLLGRHSQIPAADMQAFTDFILEVMYPPNPIRNLDNSLTSLQKKGADFFFGPKSFFDPGTDGDLLGEGTLSCSGCHAIDPNANAGSTTKPGFFGSNTLSSEVGAIINTKIPHLRNEYQKVGKFGFPLSPLMLPSPAAGVHLGEQIRGFGFLHDGGFDTVFNFMFAPNFGTGDLQTLAPPFLGVPINNPEGMPYTPEGFQTRKALDAYMMVFDSNFAPITGQQVTLTEANGSEASARIDLLIGRANADECQLIARDEKKGEGFLYDGSVFLRNKHNETPLTDAQLRARADQKKGALTYTCVPKGNGVRLALDRDLDGVLDGDEASF